MFDSRQGGKKFENRKCSKKFVLFIYKFNWQNKNFINKGQYLINVATNIKHYLLTSKYQNAINIVDKFSILDKTEKPFNFRKDKVEILCKRFNLS